jgi:hypothetical protein
MTIDSETGAPLNTTTAVARYFARPGLTKKDVADLVGELEREMLPVFVARIAAVRKLMQHGEKQAEERIATERVLNYGQEWTDPDTGVISVFSGDRREYKIVDPDGLRDALVKVGVPQNIIDRAVYKVWKIDNVTLNSIAKINEEAREAVADFRPDPGFAPAHLKEKE